MKWFSPATDPLLYRCPCSRRECDAPLPTDDLLQALDAMREAYGHPIRVTSGPRCALWNLRRGGEPDSEHLTGEGADLACTTSEERYAMDGAARAAGITRLGPYRDGHFHVGVSTTKPQRVMWLK